MAKLISVINEDFKGFSLGEFPYDHNHSALGEYHYYPNKGNCGIWYDPVVNYNYRGASWIITENEGRHHMEQMRVETSMLHKMYPMLIAGDRAWKNIKLVVKLRALHPNCALGAAFCLQNSLNFIAAVLHNNSLSLIHVHKEKKCELKKVPFKFNCDEFYLLGIDVENGHISCSINDEKVLSHTTDLALKSGKVAIIADMPAQFESVCAFISHQDLNKLNEQKTLYENERASRAKLYPAPKLVQEIDLKNFGCGRQIRFGHLLGASKWQIVFAQCQKRIHKDAYATISCLTAVDLNGNILWQRGTPNESEEFGLLSADLPFQVYDIDNDGFDEVIYAKDFEIIILNGTNGEVKKRAKTPISNDDGKLIGAPFNKYAFSRINPDCIHIANLKGGAYAQEILIKDRYCRLFALDSELNLIWEFRGGKNTGHFPYSLDINNDGKDEILCGYDLISAQGELIWSLNCETDHTDEIIAGKFTQNGEFNFALASGTQGFILASLNGKIIKRDGIGHAQRISAAKFCKNSDYQICLTNFWGHNSIVYLYTGSGEPLWELETQQNGNIIAPVNWLGDGSSLILLNPLSGLIDGDGYNVVRLPNNNHPVMCCEAINLLGDSRDELVVWDTKRMHIYTQSDVCENAVAVFKYPHYNASNYRGEYAFLDKKDLKP